MNTSKAVLFSARRRYARQEVIARECCVAFYIRPPRPGAYKLLVYAKKRDGSGIYREEETPNIGRSDEKNLYGAVCEYRLMARTPSNACLPPFPPCQTGNYGVTEVGLSTPLFSSCFYTY